MLAAAVLACLVAQGGDPTRAPAEPPGPPVPRAPIDGLPPDAANTFGIQGRFAYRRDDGGTSGGSLGPAAGFSLGATFEHRYARLDPGIELGAALNLFMDRFSMGVVGTDTSLDNQRQITQTSFAALQTAGVRLGGVRLWAGVGGGVTVAYLSTPEPQLAPGTTTAVQPLARAAAGVEIALRGRAALAILADYSHPLTHPSFTTDFGQTYAPFGDLFDAGVGLLYRF